MNLFFLTLLVGLLGALSIYIGFRYWSNSHKDFGWFFIILGVIFIVAAAAGVIIANWPAV